MVEGDDLVATLDRAIDRALWRRRLPVKRSRSRVVCELRPSCSSRMVERGIVPDILTDQTSAHDMLNGYVPDGMSLRLTAVALRESDPAAYHRTGQRQTAARHVSLDAARFRSMGAETFDYGNNIRTEARDAGVAEAFNIKGYVPEYMRESVLCGRVARTAGWRSAATRRTSTARMS
jgi:urocanate hydratase